MRYDSHPLVKQAYRNAERRIALLGPYRSLAGARILVPLQYHSGVLATA